MTVCSAKCRFLLFPSFKLGFPVRLFRHNLVTHLQQLVETGGKARKPVVPLRKRQHAHVTHAPHLQELFMQCAHLPGARLYVIPCVVPPYTQIANFVWMAVDSSRISVSNSSIDSTIFSSLNLSIKKYSVFLGYSINNSYLCKTTNKFCTNHEHD